MGSVIGSVVFVDTETTGLDDDAEVLEVALLGEGVRGHAMRGAGSTRSPSWGASRPPDERVLWVYDPDLSRASPDALRINRYYARSGEEHDECVEADHVARIVATLTAGKTLAGNNVAFDARVLSRWLRRNGQAPAWDYRLLEVCDFAAGALGLTAPWTSREVAEALGVPLPEGEQAHTALADARWAQRVFTHARSWAAANAARRGVGA